MKKFLQKIYLKISTYFLIRKLKKFGYKFIFLFFLLCPYFVSASSIYESTVARFYGSYNNSSFDYGPQNFVSLMTNNLSVMPYVENGNNYVQMPLEVGSWEIRFYFMWEVQYNTPYVPYLYAGNVRATCDGTESLDIIDSYYNSINQTYTQIMSYNCTQLDVTQTFSNWHIDFFPISGTSNRITRFMVDNVKYGTYSNDPYEDILNDLSDEVVLSNILTNQFKLEVGNFFDETGILDFSTNWNAVMSWIMPHNDPSVVWDSTCSYSNLINQTISGNLSKAISGLAACMVIGNNDLLVRLANFINLTDTAFDSLESTIATELGTYLGQTLNDVTDVSYTNRDAVFVLENIINGWADYDDIDWDDLDYRINGTANNFIMTTMTDYVTIDDKITGLVITLLSLGVVGLILHRRGY